MADGDPLDLFDAIGEFLADHRLSSEPSHYAFVHEVLRDPDGALAQRVARLTDGGVRITGSDIAALGGTAAAGAPVPSRPPRLAIVPTPPPAGSATADPVQAATDALLARTEAQVAGFSDTVRSIHAETSGFGRDLAASAAAMRGHDPLTGIDQIAELTTAMIGRVRDAEQRLADAEREADTLRDALDEARGCARRDPLTDLPNRRAFDEAFAALAPDTPVAIAVCDIDHFKRVNDDFGHAVGDRVLRAIGQTLAAEAEGALVARYGGEEFAMLIVGGDRDTTVTLVDAARSAVAARRFRSRETDTPIGSVTISGGIAFGTAADCREQLYAEADAALYRAKAAGRNRIVCTA
ncbi:diguanylate cyclase [Sphingomonas sp. TZW2008]|uniref:GGDEF domain-containing protein n=1 Tax=Sphingomonas sp. TZW2008 TaxID=1917973 RepID=UPI0035CF7270